MPRRGLPHVALVILGFVTLLACTESPAARPLPSHAEIADGIAEFAPLIDDFDQVRAILVNADGDMVFEEYYGTSGEAYWNTQSVTKSVMSTLVGIAVGEGLIQSVDQTLGELLPDYASDMSPAVAATTLQQVLTMTAGFGNPMSPTTTDFTGSKDWVRSVLENPVSPPGADFAYSNGDAHVLSAVLQEATGMSVLAYARSRLFDPLGIDSRPAAHLPPKASSLAAYDKADFAWPADPQDLNLGWALLKLRPQDMVKLGLLYLDEGRWNDSQVVPADWVHDATTTQVPAQGSGDGYGYLWWTGEVDGDPVFRAVGSGGQLIEVVPNRHLVVVVATELRLADPTSLGVADSALISLVEDGIVATFD